VDVEEGRVVPVVDVSHPPGRGEQWGQGEQRGQEPNPTFGS
jgi:hypothetical protein